jgi:hypothetical protein
MRELRSEIEIAAPPERVWEVLTDSDRYPGWNPFMRSVVGRCALGSRLTVRIKPPGARGMTFFDGEHRLAIEPLEGGRTRFVQSERFSGLLVGLFAKTLAATQRGFEQMNAALKIQVEAPS